MAVAAVLLPALGLGLQAASLVASAVGNAKKGEDEKKIAEYNAQTAEQNATYAEQQASQQQQIFRQNVAQAMGSARAGYAVSGVTQEGSPLEVLQAAASAAELDALTIKHAGDVKANAFRNDAQAFRLGGASAQSLGYLNALGDSLAAGGRLASMLKFGGGTTTQTTIGDTGGGGGGGGGSSRQDSTDYFSGRK